MHQMRTVRPRSGLSESSLPTRKLISRTCEQSTHRLSIDEGKENSANNFRRSSELQAQTPFHDITNVVGCQKLSSGKQGCLQTFNSAQNLFQSVGHPIIRTQNSNNPTYACRETITSSAKQRGIAPKNASEIKRYRNRDRYWRMTPEHRDAYLQRNREYKRKRKSSCTNSDIVQSAVSQATTTHISTGTEVAMDRDSSMSSYGIIKPTGGSLIQENLSGISTSDDTLNTATHLASIDQTSSKYKRRRLSGQPSCSTARETYECGSNLLNQPVPLQMPQLIAEERDDHDSAIYVPKDYFPVVQDEFEQSGCVIESDDDDDESCISSREGYGYVSHRELNHAMCATEVDPYDFIYQNLPSGHHVLKMVPNCTYCNAKRFQYETPAFCCMGGKIKIVTPRIPDEMLRLYTSQDSDAKYFQDNIR